MTKKFGIIGNPIKHSLSPVLHNYWFEKYSIDANYSLINIEESELPEIVKNIALIYVQLGENEKAISAIQDARKINPDDVNLILNEADLYIRLGDRNKFKELMEQAIEKDPNNAVLYYNLGVI